MSKNCSRCKNKHLPPFGSRCKMAVVEGMDRTSDAYLKFLEDEFVRRKLADKGKDPEASDLDGARAEDKSSAEMKLIMNSLQDITNRLGRLESSPGSSLDTAGTVGVSAARLIADPLTKALSKLSGEEEDTGTSLRPETYAQSDLKTKNRDHTKMDSVSLFYGWISVIDYLIRSGGDVKSYVNHVKYTTEMLNSRLFYDCCVVKYDRMIVDRYMCGRSINFNPDPVTSTLAFSSKVIPDSVDMFPGASLHKGVHSYQAAKQNKRRRNPGAMRSKQDETPSDFPPDVCFYFNYRQCLEENCPKAHVCRKCQGKHRADTCRRDTRRT